LSKSELESKISGKEFALGKNRFMTHFVQLDPLGGAQQKKSFASLLKYLCILHSFVQMFILRRGLIKPSDTLSISSEMAE
jgi:hypothetical protein